MAAAAELRVHHFLPLSYTNGPGARAVIWVQGCSLGCPGCFNPKTHPTRGGELLSVDTLFDRITTLGSSVEGVTLSGGEPLQQRAAVTHLLLRLRQETALSTLLFSGFTWEEIQRMGGPVDGGLRIADRRAWVQRAKGDREMLREMAGMADSDSLPDIPLSPSASPYPLPSAKTSPEFLRYLDVLIAGRYDQTQRFADGLRGSENKTVHLLTDRYTMADLEAVPPAELILGPDGEIVISGIDPVRW